jgi:hypothetical protein
MDRSSEGGAGGFGGALATPSNCARGDPHGSLVRSSYFETAATHSGSGGVFSTHRLIRSEIQSHKTKRARRAVCSPVRGLPSIRSPPQTNQSDIRLQSTPDQTVHIVWSDDRQYAGSLAAPASRPRPHYGHRWRPRTLALGRRAVQRDLFHLLEKLGAAAVALHGEHEAKAVRKRWHLRLTNSSTAALRILDELRSADSRSTLDPERVAAVSKYDERTRDP